VDSLPTLVAEAAAIGATEAQAVRDESIAQHGVTWAKPSDAMQKSLDAWFASERAAVQAWGEDKKVPDTAKILDQFEAAVKKWNAISDQVGNDKAKFRDALVKEVYSKVTF